MKPFTKTGELKNVDNFSFGPNHDYKIVNTEFTKFGAVLEHHTFSRVSICSCDQLYCHFFLLSKNSENFNEDLHRLIWAQFAKAWYKISDVLTVNFEVISDSTEGLQKMQSSYDVAIAMHLKNSSEEQVLILIPYQPLHVFLKRDHSVYAPTS